MPSLTDIVLEVDRRAPAHALGALQDHRKALRNLARKPTRNVFEWARNPDYAFHVGGRGELQFNLGFEDDLPGGADLRYGVAFSLEPSRSMPGIDALVPRIALFNDYLREHPEAFSGLFMWHHDARGRSSPSAPAPISSELVQLGTFIFLGAVGSRASPDFDEIMRTFDRLMPLWLFVEERIEGVPQRPSSAWEIRPGLPPRVRTSAATYMQLTLDVDRRHVALQDALHAELVREFGFSNVGVEHPAPGGGLVDVIVQTGGGVLLFEIKTAATARGCIREALGQLLDYGCWPGAPPVLGLVVAGKPVLDGETSSYLERLSGGFPVKLSYRRIMLD